MEILPTQRVPGIPSPERNQADAVGVVSARSTSREVTEFHRDGLRSRRHRDLTSEKYLLHVDGEGGSQWLDLYHGTRLKIPTNVSGAVRVQNNQLRPIVDNYVAHLTTQPYRFVVEAPPDRKAREAAIIDQALINQQVRLQRWNSLWAEAKYMAACFGFCPVHAAWREDMATDPYETVAVPMPDGTVGLMPIRAGNIDSWVGNPGDTVFDSGARRGSMFRTTYGRMLPAELVRTAFAREDLEGTDRIPSSSTFQRTARRWLQASGNVHGSAVMLASQHHDELIHLIYDETAPGVVAEWPMGRLRIVAMQGKYLDTVDERNNAVLLWEGPLPASVFSFVNVYSHFRGDDILGKQFVADLDEDQIQLNQLESLVTEYLRRASRPPLASSGRVNVETIDYRGDVVLEAEPLGPGQVELRYLEYPARHVNILESKIERVLDSMYRKGGWQAASRGEMRGSGKAIIALQQADDSIFGPMSMRTKEELEQFCRLNWSLAKTFMDVPMVIEAAGDEVAHLAEAYVDRTKLSERPPVFTLVSGFGTSMEAKAQQLMNLFGMVDQRGEQVLGTRELRRLWPDQSLFRQVDDPSEIRERRPQVINASIRKFASDMRKQYPQLPYTMGDPMVQQLAQFGLQQIDQWHPVLMDDDIAGHIESLSAITQDETEDPLARRIAIMRQQMFWMWLSQKQMAGAPMPSGQPQGGQQGPGAAMARSNSAVQQAVNMAQPGAGTTVNAASMQQADRNFENQVRSA